MTSVLTRSVGVVKHGFFLQRRIYKFSTGQKHLRAKISPCWWFGFDLEGKVSPKIKTTEESPKSSMPFSATQVVIKCWPTSTSNPTTPADQNGIPEFPRVEAHLLPKPSMWSAACDPSRRGCRDGRWCDLPCYADVLHIGSSVFGWLALVWCYLDHWRVFFVSEMTN